MPKTPPDPHVDQWVDMTDFTPGCFNNTYVSGAKQIIIAPQTAATPTTTLGCMGLPNGGLGPLPAATTGYVFPAKTGGYTPQYQTGFITNPTNTGIEILHMVESEHGSKHNFQVRSFHTWNSTYHTILHVDPTKIGGYFCCPYPAMTRMTTKTTATKKPGQPVVVFPWACSSDAHKTSGHLYVYPPIATPSTYGLQDLITGSTPFSSVTGQVIAHQGRIICLAGINYPWPDGNGIPTNEQVCFTTPANSDTYKFQQEVLVPEFPYGYGGMGSISAYELFLIKKRGGGLRVTGDINSPNVTFLPGVQSTGDIYGMAGATPGGLFYCSDKQGAWLWNGSNLAQKVSTQLDDDFYIVPDITPNQNNICYYVAQWGDWVLFSNSWIYNLITKSWWRLSTAPLFYYQPGESSDTIFAGVQTISPANSTYFAFKFDKSVPVNTWTWKSLPIRLSENKFINIREIVVYASNSDSSASSQIRVNIYVTGTQVFTFQTTTGEIGLYPTLLRIPCGVNTSENLTVKVTASAASGHGAPVLHQLSFGIKTRQHTKTL